MRRVNEAIFGASMGSAGITTIGLWAFNASQVDGFSPDFSFAYIAYFALSAIVVALVSYTIGLAWHAFARRRNWNSVHAYWLPALLVGATPPQIMFLPPLLSAPATANLSSDIWALTSVYGAALGGLTGLFAWLIRRPDRDAANPPTSAP